jgi:hypothetical protein
MGVFLHHVERQVGLGQSERLIGELLAAVEAGLECRVSQIEEEMACSLVELFGLLDVDVIHEKPTDLHQPSSAYEWLICTTKPLLSILRRLTRSGIRGDEDIISRTFSSLKNLLRFLLCKLFSHDEAANDILIREGVYRVSDLCFCHSDQNLLCLRRNNRASKYHNPLFLFHGAPS